MSETKKQEVENEQFDEYKALTDNYSPDFKVRLLRYIGKTNTGSCNTKLYEQIKLLFQNEFKEVRAEAFLTVGLIFSRSGNKNILEDLKKYAKTEKQEQVIIGILEGIGRILEENGDKEHYSFLRDFLFHKREKIRKTATRATSVIFRGTRDKKIVRDLLKALSLTTLEEFEYISAIENVLDSKATEEDFIKLLRDGLSSKDSQVAVGATKILANIFKSKTFIDEIIVNQLMELAEKTIETRKAVADALGQIYVRSRNKRITNFLESLLKNERNKDTRKAIFLAIKEINRT